MKHVTIRVFGRVQGVFFRYSAKRRGEKLGIKGFARNEADGSVYMEVEGDALSLEKFLAWCRKGPPFASVESIKTEEGALKNFTEFTVA